MRGRLAVNLMKRRGFAASRMVCIETASNRRADMLEQPSVGVPMQPAEASVRAAVLEASPLLGASMRPLNLLSVRPHVPLAERRYPVPNR